MHQNSIKSVLFMCRIKPESVEKSVSSVLPKILCNNMQYMCNMVDCQLGLGPSLLVTYSYITYGYDIQKEQLHERNAG